MSELDLSTPYITGDLPGIGGTIKADPGDFIVHEIPSYKPLGHGEHLYVNITKQMMTTRDVQLALAELLGLNNSDIGTAGLKDKHAITTQTFSINLGRRASKMVDEAVNLIKRELGVKVNWVGLHPRKLRSGHLNGNKFIVTITSLDDNVSCTERTDKIQSVIDDIGVPNYYGIQRIGEKGENVISGWEILTEKKRVRDRWLMRYLMSSYLGYLCNRYLSERVRTGTFTRLLRGDLAQKHDTGGIFWVEDPVIEQPRFINKEISFTAPIYGIKMRRAKDESRSLEDQILSASDITWNQLRRMNVKGTRRLGRLTPKILSGWTGRGLRLEFTLPKGGYATTVLREFMKTI